jgi:hypothetical protein
MLAIVGLCILGCTTAWHANKVQYDTTKAAMSGWADYWTAATNGATPAELAQLDKERWTVDSAWRQYSRSVKVANDMINATDISTNIQTQVDAAIRAAAANQSNLIWIITSFQTKKAQ